MALNILQELRVRLHARGVVALQQMGHLSEYCELEKAWWLHAPDSVDCWWMRVPSSFDGPDVDLRTLHDGTAALVLLRTLTRLVAAACRKEVESPWPTESSRNVHDGAGMTEHREIGVMYLIRSRADLVALREGVVGRDSPVDSLLNDYAWCQDALRCVPDRLPLGSIPVRVCITLRYETPDQQTYVLRQLVRLVTAQQQPPSSSQHTIGDVNAQVSASARFEIVEVEVGNQARALINVAALECLAKLTQLGVRVRHLPDLFQSKVDELAHVSVARSLAALMPSDVENNMQKLVCPREIYFSNRGSSSSLVPAIFSAIQASRTVDTVEIELHGGVPHVHAGDHVEQVLRFWQWAGYTLFSRHARHKVKTVVLHVDLLDARAIDAMAQVLRAKNPLARLFNTTNGTERWILASQFHVVDPEHEAHTSNRSLLCTAHPLGVRVIDRLDRGDTTWWRVLVPGRGDGWVGASQATEIEQSDPQFANVSDHSNPLALRLGGFFPRNMDHVLALLRLLPCKVNSIEIKPLDEGAETFDVTAWTHDVLRLFPTLERLKMPGYMAIDRLLDLAVFAETGHSQLRTLTLGQVFHFDSPDVVQFMTVLCDASHPLTRQLEDLRFGIYLEDDEAEAFATAWSRLLQQNRNLHYIALLVIASKWVDVDEGTVAIRSGPLCMRAKLGFLSIFHVSTTTGRVSKCSSLATDTIAAIFACAAPHCIRTIDIDIHSPY